MERKLARKVYRTVEQRDIKIEKDNLEYCDKIKKDTEMVYYRIWKKILNKYTKSKGVNPCISFRLMLDKFEKNEHDFNEYRIGWLDLTAGKYRFSKEYLFELLQNDGIILTKDKDSNEEDYTLTVYEDTLREVSHNALKEKGVSRKRK